MRKKTGKYLIGIDEVGRGALAGPVTVAAVLLPKKFQISKSKLQIKTKLRDSKKLTLKQREIWFKYIKNHPKIFYATASVCPKIIDRINVSRAANLAAVRAFKKLISISNLSSNQASVFLDGGLFLKGSNFENFSKRTIVKGDEKIVAITLASIMAKVTRDNNMKRRNKNYPVYSFFMHKGYGTKNHFREIDIFGISRMHRLSFLSKN